MIFTANSIDSTNLIDIKDIGDTGHRYTPNPLNDRCFNMHRHKFTLHAIGANKLLYSLRI